MSTRNRTILIVVCAFFVFSIAGWGIARLILLKRFQALEIEQVQNDTLQMQNFIDNNFTDMHTSIADWANWDDTYSYIQGTNPSYWGANWMENTFRTLGLNFVSYLRPDLSFLNSAGFDLSTGQTIPIPSEIFQLVQSKELLLNSKQETSATFALPEGVFLIVAHPVYHSDLSDPLGGYLIWGRLIDQNLLSHLQQSIGSQVSLLTLAKNQALFNSLITQNQSTNKPVLVIPNGKNDISGYLFLPGVSGTPVAILQLNQARTIYQQGVASLNWVVLVNILLGIILTLVFVILIDRFIVRPLQKLRSEVPLMVDMERPGEKIKSGLLGDLGSIINLVFSTAKAEQAKATSQQKMYSKLIEHSQDGYALINADDNTIRYVNPSFIDLFHAGDRNLVGEKVIDFISSKEKNPAKLSLLENWLTHKRGSGSKNLKLNIEDPTEGSRQIEIAVIKNNDLVQPTINLIAKDITVRQKMGYRLQTQLDETSLVNRVLSSTIKSMDLHAILNSVCFELSRAFQVENAAFASIFDKNQPIRFFKASSQESGKETFFEIDLFKDEKFKEELANNKAFLYTSEKGIQSRISKEVGKIESTSQASMMIPVSIDNEVIGVIRLVSGKKKEFSREEFELGTQVALITSQAIEIARLYSDINHELHERKMIEETLEKREKYFSTIVQIQAALLSSDEEEMINQAVLEQLGEISQASRIYYYQDVLEATGSRYSLRRMQWSSDELNTNSALLIPEKVDYTKIPAWAEKLKRGEIVSGKVGDLLPTLPPDIKSLLLLPILVGGKYVGFIGFDNCTDNRSWDEMEIALLQVATSSLALAQEHKQAVKALLQSQAGQLLMLDQLPALLINIDTQFKITSVRGSWLRSIGKNEDEAISIVKRNIKKDENINKALKSAMEGVRVSFESHWEAITFQMYLEPFRDETSKIVGVIVLALDISERKRSEDTLRRSEESIRTLYTIASSKELNYSEKIRSLLMMGCQHFNSDTGLITQIDEKSAVVQHSYSRGSKIVPGMSFNLEETLDAEILKNHEPIYFDSSKNSSWNHHPIAQKRKIESFIGAGIEVTGKPSRTITFFSPKPHREPFTASDFEFIRLMAQWVGAELEREDYVRKIQQYAEEISRNSHALAEARDQALEAARTKSEFLATMSHEIRTPLNAVIGMAELLLDSPINSEQREYTTVARDSAQILLSLISDILDFSKIEAGKVELEAIAFDPAQTIEGAVDLFSAKAHEKGIAMMSFIAPEIPNYLEGDPVRLKQVLINLLSNALKFTSKGEILINMTLQEQDADTALVKIEVKDTGIGIKPEAKHLLFQPFSQADGSTTRKYGGTGLGLAISKKLVELMGGKIGFYSKPGKGSTFYFTARFKKVSLAGDTHKPIGLKRLAGVPILVVDDSSTHREILDHYLKSWKMKPSLAEDGKTALSRFEESAAGNMPFHLALLDMQLPDMDGFELAKELKNQAAGKDLQVILLTAFDRRGLGDSALKAGFSAFLTKPVKQSQLLDTISNLIGKPTIEKKPIHVEPFKSSLPKVSKEADSRKVNILLAEDNPANQKLALAQIQKLGYLVNAVDNGKKAVEIVISDPHRYAMVLMDCQMPEMDGFEATRMIRRSEKSTKTHIPIIAMTANAMEGDRKVCEKAGMDDYISKPVTLKILAELLERWSPSQGKNFTKKESKEKRKMKITLDKNILNNIRELQSEGEEDLLSELIDVYEKDSKQTITKIHTSSKQGDMVAVRRAAHSLKGSSANMGAAELAAICHILETAAGEGDSTKITGLLSELNETYNQTVKELVKLKKPK